jgi:predicted transcriptional regulator
MARALESGAVLESPVSDVMGPPYPVVDAMLPIERLTAFLSRESPAVLVRRDGKIAGIVTRYDVLRQVSGIK